jgi:hypothetical protein
MGARESEQLAKGCMLRISKIFSPRKQKGLVEIN